MSLTARLLLIAASGRLLTRCADGCQAGLAELVDALDSDSSVRKDFRVQVPGSASTQVKQKAPQYLPAGELFCAIASLYPFLQVLFETFYHSM